MSYRCGRAEGRTEINVGGLKGVAVGNMPLGDHLQVNLRPRPDILKGNDLLKCQRRRRFKAARADLIVLIKNPVFDRGMMAGNFAEDA